MTHEELELMLNGCPFHRLLKMDLIDFDEDIGSVKIGLNLQEVFSRSDDCLELHGGITAALIDIAGDYAVIVKTGVGVPTINLRIDYLKMGRGNRIVASAKAIRVGRTIGTVDIEVTDEDNNVIALGRGTYSTSAATKPRGNITT